MSQVEPSSRAFALTKIAAIIQPMTDALQNNYPQLCMEVGLTCESCVAETGRQLAASCKGLRGKMIGQLFVQIHPHPACARMHAQFAQAYRSASHDVYSSHDVCGEAPRAMAAVA